MGFQLVESAKLGLIAAICVAISVYLACQLIKPHIVTRQNGAYLDNNLVTTYSGFVALVTFITIVLMNFSTTFINPVNNA